MAFNYIFLIFAGTLNPSFSPNWNLGKHAIFSPQGEYFYVRNATFMNYGQSGALTGCNECEVGSEMNQGAFTTRCVAVCCGVVWCAVYDSV